MMLRALRTGLRHVRHRPGLVALVVGVHLVVALVLSLAFYGVLDAALTPTGLGDVLVRDFDAVLWHDLVERYGAAFEGLIVQALWVVPMMWVTKTLLRAGLVYALGRGGGRPLAEGVRRHGPRALLLALLYGVVLGAWLVVTALVGWVLNMLASGPVALVWVNLAGLPVLFGLGVVLVDMMHDYSRTALVLARQGVVQAWRTGLVWPWRRPAAIGVYATWLVFAGALWAAPLLLDAALPAVTSGGLWGLFVLQQIALAGRAATTVGWIGSEVAVYEEVNEAEWPLIAGAAEGRAAAGVA